MPFLLFLWKKVFFYSTTLVVLGSLYFTVIFQILYQP
nr:MAG TPA: hypothetical protein [Caudoviricetes sp.]